MDCPAELNRVEFLYRSSPWGSIFEKIRIFCPLAATRTELKGWGRKTQHQKSVEAQGTSQKIVVASVLLEGVLEFGGYVTSSGVRLCHDDSLDGSAPRRYSTIDGHRLRELPMYDKGVTAGKDWVADTKRFDRKAAKRLSGLRYACENDEDWNAHFIESSDRPTAGERLYWTMWPANDGDRNIAKEFWRSVGGDPHPNPDFVRGFADGVVEACLDITA
jgi:hypothetical protein